MRFIFTFVLLVALVHATTFEPFLVNIKNDNKPMCRGIVISKRLVLTSAECVKDIKTGTLEIHSKQLTKPAKVDKIEFNENKEDKKNQLAIIIQKEEFKDVIKLDSIDFDGKHSEKCNAYWNTDANPDTDKELKLTTISDNIASMSLIFQDETVCKSFAKLPDLRGIPTFCSDKLTGIMSSMKEETKGTCIPQMATFMRLTKGNKDFVEKMIKDNDKPAEADDKPPEETKLPTPKPTKSIATSGLIFAVWPILPGFLLLKYRDEF